MSFWTFVFAISVAGIIFSYLKHSDRVDSKTPEWSQQVNLGNTGGADTATLQSIEIKLEQMERRLQSLETIVIEHERHDEFDQALNR